MLVDFNIQNFASVKERQTLSFEATKSKHLEDYYVVRKGKYRLLKLALIYGANASGKTTILKALDFLRGIVLNPFPQKSIKFNFAPFLFDKETPKQDTEFSIKFIIDERIYSYSVSLNQQAISTEELKVSGINRQSWKNIFKRSTDYESQVANIEFNPRYNISHESVKALSLNTLWNNTVLAGFSKTNVNLKELNEVLNWFDDTLHNIFTANTEISHIITKLIYENKINKSILLNSLQKADFNIRDISIKREEFDVPKEFLLKLFEKSGIEDEHSPNFADSGKIEAFDINFIHSVVGENFQLPLNMESEGTQRYYGLSGLLAYLLPAGKCILIDELEASLHPDLFEYFLLSFLANSTSSQVISTTHNREILGDKTIIRNDAIWITDKNQDCSTSLYSVADFKTDVVRDTTNVLNVYKAGRLGGVPKLSDYSLELNNGTQE